MKQWLFSIFRWAVALGTATFASATTAQFPLDAQFDIDKSWTGGYQITVTLTNNSLMPTSTSWSSSFALLDPSQSITSLWNGTYTVTGENIVVSNLSTNKAIAAGQSKTFGMTIANPKAGVTGISGLQASALGTVPPIPTAPVLSAIPANPSVSNGYTVSWTSVTDGASYILQQDVSSAFSNPQVVSQGLSLSYTAANQSDGTYYYRVSAVDAAGASSYSNVETATVPVVLPAPSLPIIVNPFGVGQYIISWGTVPYAQQYALQEATQPDFSNAQTIFTGAATSLQVSGRSPNTYYYQVQAIDGTNVSAYSNSEKVVVTATPSPIVESYWESWNSTSATSINTIVHMDVDVINIAFANFTTTGTNTYVIAGIDCSQASLTQFITAAHEAGRKVKIAIGGATYPLAPQLQVMADAEGMAQAIATFVQANNLDGVDFDIEDRPAASLEVALLQNTRQLLGPNALISYTPKSPASTTSPWDQVIYAAYQYVSYISIMAYDYSPGYTYQNDVANLIAKGVPASKIVIGLMPGYDDLHVMTSVADIVTASQYILAHGLAGIMFWDLNLDLENKTGLGVDAATNTAWSILH